MADQEHPGPTPPTRQEMEDEICRDILAIHRDSYGGGAARVSAYVLDDVVIVLLDGLELLPGEALLIERGREEAVVAMRSEFQQAIGPSFKAAVERATGRRVVSFASHFQVEEPIFALEVFRLGPA